MHTACGWMIVTEQSAYLVSSTLFNQATGPADSLGSFRSNEKSANQANEKK